jgi:hypothetical protein
MKMSEDTDIDSANEEDIPPEIQGPLAQKQNRERPKEEGIVRSTENVRFTDEEDLAIVEAILVVEENNMEYQAPITHVMQGSLPKLYPANGQ